MIDCELRHIDPEDIEDLLVKVEKSVSIEFVGNELIALSTFGELCDHIKNKIRFDHTDDCIMQQAFCKIRNAISSTTVNKNEIEDVLTELFSNGLGLEKAKLSRDSRFV